jgi:hypothetical protein
MSFAKPIDANVTQRFGADFRQSDGRWYYKQVLGYQGHNGDDYAAPGRTPIKAADEGTITFEGWGQNHSWMGAPAGICVLINNGGVYSGYAHMVATTVNKGQRVSKGQVIGYVGATGAATGNHLHFEALPLAPDFKNGFAGRIDPSQFIETTNNSQGDEPVIGNADNWRGRVSREFWAHWGRGPTEEEFQAQVGHTMLTLAERLGDNPETQNQINRAAVGRIAIDDGWAQQIQDRTAERDAAHQSLAAASEEIAKLKLQVGGLDASTQEKINQTAADTSWLRNLLSTIFNRN